MTGKEIFAQSCKHFADWGITPELLKTKDNWLPITFDDLKDVLIHDITTYYGNLRFQNEMLTYVKNMREPKDAWLPIFFIMTRSAVSFELLSQRIASVLYYCAKSGDGAYSHVSNIKRLSDAINALDFIHSKDELFFEANRILNQALYNDSGIITTTVSATVQKNYEETITNFTDWIKGIQSFSLPDVSVPDTLVALTSDIVTTIYDYRQELNYPQACTERLRTIKSADEILSVIMHMASCYSVPDDTVLMYLIRALRLIIIANDAAISHSTTVPAFKDFRDLAWRCASLGELDKHVPDIFIKSSGATIYICTSKESNIPTDDSVLSTVARLLEPQLKTQGLERVLLTIESAVQTMPKATVQSNFLQLLKTYMEAH